MGHGALGTNGDGGQPTPRVIRLLYCPMSVGSRIVAIGTPLVTRSLRSMSNQSMPKDVPENGSQMNPIVVCSAFSGLRFGLPPNVTVYCVEQSGLLALAGLFGSGQRSGSLRPACDNPGTCGFHS